MSQVRYTTVCLKSDVIICLVYTTVCLKLDVIICLVYTTVCLKLDVIFCLSYIQQYVSSQIYNSMSQVRYTTVCLVM